MAKSRPVREGAGSYGPFVVAGVLLLLIGLPTAAWLDTRLQSIAEPGGIVMSYETYALVNDMVRAHPMPPIMVKGIRREIVPYAFEGLVDELKQRPNVISEHGKGVDVFLDLEVMDKVAVERTRRLLQQAIAALELKAKSGPT